MKYFREPMADVRLIHTRLAFALLIVVASGLLAQPTGTAFMMDYAYRGPLTWQLGTRSVVFEYKKGVETFFREGETVIYRLPFPQVITGVIASENKKTLLIHISLIQERGGWNYDHLMTLSEEAADKRVVIHECLSTNEPSMKRKWIVEVGAVSDDGQVALVKMGEPDDERPSYNVNHVWQKWDLKSQELIGVGMKLCN